MNKYFYDNSLASKRDKFGVLLSMQRFRYKRKLKVNMDTCNLRWKAITNQL